MWFELWKMLILDCDKNIRIFWPTFGVARTLFLNCDQVGSFFFTPTHCYQMFLDNTPCDNKYTGNKYIWTSTKSWMFLFSFVWMRKSEAVSHQLGGGWWCQVFGLITKWGQPAIFNLLYMSDAPFGGGQCHAASCVVTAFDLRSSWWWYLLMIYKKSFFYEGVGYWCILCKSYCTLTKCGECGFRLLLLPMMMMVMGVWVLFQFRDFLGADLCRTCSFRYFQVILKQKIFSSSTHVM